MNPQEIARKPTHGSMRDVGSAVRSTERARRLGERFLREGGTGFRDARLMLGLSQGHVAASADLSRTRYGRIEAGRVPSLSILEYCRIAVVLGLDPAIRLYPGGVPVRDAAHADRLRRLIALARPPLVARTEVPLPIQPDRREQRAWDLVYAGHGQRTAVELEMRLADVQALIRRIALKRRDDAVEQFILAIADTRTNRRVLAEYPDMFAELPRLRPSLVWRALEAGQLPPTGILLV